MVVTVLLDVLYGEHANDDDLDYWSLLGLAETKTLFSQQSLQLSLSDITPFLLRKLFGSDKLKNSHH